MKVFVADFFKRCVFAKRKHLFMIDHTFFFKLFGIEKKTVQEKKGFDPNKIIKRSFFCIMQIFKIILNQPQLHCPTDISETYHLNPVLLMMSYCNGKLTFHGCNYFFFNRFKRKCFLQKYQFLSIPSNIQGFDLSEFSFQNLFWSTQMELSLSKPQKTINHTIFNMRHLCNVRTSHINLQTLKHLGVCPGTGYIFQKKRCS